LLTAAKLGQSGMSWLQWKHISDSYFISEQEHLYAQYIEACLPSHRMTLSAFRSFITAKGLKVNRVKNTFR
jgi:hypothetical protein